MPANITDNATAAIDQANTIITNTPTNPKQKNKPKVKGKGGRGDAYT